MEHLGTLGNARESAVFRRSVLQRRFGWRTPPGDARKARFYWVLGWLGRQDSNLGMAESKSAALPLGYAPSGWRDLTCKAAASQPSPARSRAAVDARPPARQVADGSMSASPTAP